MKAIEQRLDLCVTIAIHTGSLLKFRKDLPEIRFAAGSDGF